MGSSSYIYNARVSRIFISLFSRSSRTSRDLPMSGIQKQIPDLFVSPPWWAVFIVYPDSRFSSQPPIIYRYIENPLLNRLQSSIFNCTFKAVKDIMYKSLSEKDLRKFSESAFGKQSSRIGFRCSWFIAIWISVPTTLYLPVSIGKCW